MPLNPADTPENLLNPNDPGDETQRRFRYQATYTALQSLAMLDEESEVICVFCEHWEDILVKCSNGRFIGIQVKTRAIGKAPFKSNDKEILNSIKNFIQLEKTFAADFDRYVLATNCGFWQERKNSGNLAYLTEEVATKNEDVASSNKHLSSFLKKLIKVSQEEEALIINTLKKVFLESSPGLEDIESRLLQSLIRFPQVRDFSVQKAWKIADRLISLALKASALPQSSTREEYLSLLKDPVQEKISLTIQDKKITKEEILQIINSEISDPKSLTLLTTYNQPSLSELIKGMRTMELKMIAGEISAANIELAKSHKSSAEYLLQQWLFKYGAKKADSQYQHLCNIIWTECREAYDDVYAETSSFGTEMLQELRKRLRDRYNQDRTLFLGCTYEHLYGIIGILTEECLVWWSLEFDIPMEEIS